MTKNYGEHDRHVLQTSYYRLVSKDVCEDGVIKSVSMMEEFDTAKTLADTDYNDYRVANLIAVGSFKGTPVVLSPNDNTTAVDAFSQSISTLKSSDNV